MIEANQECIGLVKKEIAKIEEIILYLDTTSDELYKNNYTVTRNILPKSYEIKKILENLNKILEIYQELDKKDFDFTKRIEISKDLVFSFNATPNGISPFFYIENELSSWLYENVIGSWSGINEWATSFIDDRYTLYSGNSEYNYAFGTTSLPELFNAIKVYNISDTKENKTNISVEKIVSLIINISLYMQPSNYLVMEMTVKDFENTIKNLKEIYKD